MSLMDDIKGKARAASKHVVLPEGTEERTIKAAAIIAKEGIAQV
ncbi:MAG: phosphate acetyltransferase, partial [Clostridia bacterium]|nr:phosphate acetyltransferase [Clostridia bacterium]